MWCCTEVRSPCPCSSTVGWGHDQLVNSGTNSVTLQKDVCQQRAHAGLCLLPRRMCADDCSRGLRLIKHVVFTATSWKIKQPLKIKFTHSSLTIYSPSKTKISWMIWDSIYRLSPKDGVYLKASTFLCFVLYLGWKDVPVIFMLQKLYDFHLVFLLIFPNYWQ